jgi:hypothetical protein
MEKVNAGVGVSSRFLNEIVVALKEKIAALKQSRCLNIWEKINKGQEEAKIEINDSLWSNVKGSFNDKLCNSLIKFFSSFICQTGTFELTKSFFLFNLAAAADQRKFFLHESLLE